MIVLVMAMAAEVKPVRTFFRLRRSTQHSLFPWYEDGELVVIQTGIGRKATTAAVDYAGAQLQRIDRFVNFGICGHSHLEIGSLLCASQITGPIDAQQWDLSVPAEFAIPSVRLLTVDAPQQEYSPNCAVDMEAAGFCAAALRFVAPSQLLCLKVVSDNPSQHWSTLTRPGISCLIRDHITTLKQIIEKKSIDG